MEKTKIMALNTHMKNESLRYDEVASTSLLYGR